MTLTALRALLFATLAATVVFPAVARVRALPAQAPAPSIPNGTNVVLGRVVEIGTTVPVAGAIVTLTGHVDASGKPVTPNPIARGPELPPSLNVMTTADGYFVFRNLPAGLFTAATRAHGYMDNDFPPTVVEIRDSMKSASGIAARRSAADTPASPDGDCENPNSAPILPRTSFSACRSRSSSDASGSGLTVARRYGRS